MGKTGPSHPLWAILGCSSILCFAPPANSQPSQPEAGIFPASAKASNQSPVPPPDATDSDCGDEEKDLPSFELIDLNSNSPTFGSTFTLDTFQSEVLVIYWALAS